MLNEEEKRELRELARSPQLRQDARALAQKRRNPFVVGGKTDMDALVLFLTEYNYFINHASRPLGHIADRVMKL